MTSGNINNNIQSRIKDNKKIVLPKLDIILSKSKKNINNGDDKIRDNYVDNNNNLFAQKINFNKIKIAQRQKNKEQNELNNKNENSEKDPEKLPLIQSTSISKPTTASITPKYKGNLVFFNPSNNAIYTIKKGNFSYNP